VRKCLSAPFETSKDRVLGWIYVKGNPLVIKPVPGFFHRSSSVYFFTSEMAAKGKDYFEIMRM
jgi:hypothetical protein